MTERHALANLIDQVESTNRWSDSDVVKRAAQRGHKLSKQTISRLRTENPLVSIKGASILGLADGLGVTPGQVAMAALSAMRVPVAESSNLDAEVAIRRDVSLSEESRAMLLALIRQIRSDTGDRNEDTRTQGTPGSPTAHGKAGTRRTPMKLVKSTDKTDENQAEDLDAPPIFDDHELAAARDEGMLSEEKQRRLDEDQDRS